MYQVTDDSGKVYQFSTDQYDTADLTEVQPSAEATSSEFRTVARLEIDEGDGVALGIGKSRNPDRAEGYLYFDARDGGNAKISGRLRFVVLNATNDVVAVISRHRLEQLRSGGPTAADRKDRMPYPYQVVKNGKGEILGGSGYSVGVQIETASGTATYSNSNSTAVIEGHAGTQIN